MKNWNNCLNFWVILSYPSLDCLSAKLGILIEFVLLVIISISAILLLFTASMIYVKYNKPPPNFIQKLIRILCLLIGKIYYIPATMACLIIFKYSSGLEVSVGHIIEYVPKI